MHEDVNALILRQLEGLHERIDEIAPRVVPEHFTKQQVANQLNVSADTVNRWCNRGELPTFRHGAVIRIRRTALEKFLKKQTWSA